MTPSPKKFTSAILSDLALQGLQATPSQQMPVTVSGVSSQNFDRCLYINRSVPQRKLPVGLLHLLFISAGFHTQQLKRVLDGCSLYLQAYQPCVQAAAM